ncbi:hypothetical protein [Chenggangzhangella methanolivorans]|uniref:HTH luxR-type domain-containing protein n=1 Tax=Chenggangzhangella methanolivorans TaxID=1437009 RepID=A0A9E6RFN4_9HYPH|nr:hypothetical protein [Chenggangzhangella methanolivorans]QZO00441.1 hypothetical protein K6K41_01355 [Chenggangzhangella methanolivorans]
MVTPAWATAAPSASILSGLFDLTPAEARVTRQLIEGAAVNEIAESSGLSESTIRNQPARSSPRRERVGKASSC